MGNVDGMKELNQHLSRINRSLERIAKTMDHIDKVIDRRVSGSAAPKEPRNDIPDYMGETDDEYEM